MMNALGELWRKPRGWVFDVLPVALYLVVLFAACLMPLKSLPGPQFKWVDKVWHLAAFAVLTVLLARALAHFRAAGPKVYAQAAWASAALGGLLEVLQGMTAFRSAELADLVADGLGALVAYVVLRRLG
jgi:VanZ family protein